MTTTTSSSFVYDYDAVYFEDGYCASVMECTDNEGMLSLRNAERLCEDHGTTLEELFGDNISLHAPKILEWLGY